MQDLHSKTFALLTCLLAAVHLPARVQQLAAPAVTRHVARLEPQLFDCPAAGLLQHLAAAHRQLLHRLHAVAAGCHIGEHLPPAAPPPLLGVPQLRLVMPRFPCCIHRCRSHHGDGAAYLKGSTTVPVRCMCVLYRAELCTSIVDEYAIQSW